MKVKITMVVEGSEDLNQLVEDPSILSEELQENFFCDDEITNIQIEKL